VLNKTDQIVYFRSLQYLVTGQALTNDELDRWKITWPIQPQEERKFLVSFSTLVSPNWMHFNTGWRIGSHTNNPSSASHLFYLDRHEGSCQMKIEIYDESYKVIPKETFYCYKKN
jgi:hypothetical protein